MRRVKFDGAGEHREGSAGKAWGTTLGGRVEEAEDLVEELRRTAEKAGIVLPVPAISAATLR